MPVAILSPHVLSAGVGWPIPMWSAFVAPAALAPGFDLKQPDRSYSFGRNLAAEISNCVFATNNISNGQKRGSPTYCGDVCL